MSIPQKKHVGISDYFFRIILAYGRGDEERIYSSKGRSKWKLGTVSRATEDLEVAEQG